MKMAHLTLSIENVEEGEEGEDGAKDAEGGSLRVVFIQLPCWVMVSCPMLRQHRRPAPQSVREKMMPITLLIVLTQLTFMRWRTEMLASLRQSDVKMTNPSQQRPPKALHKT